MTEVSPVMSEEQQKRCEEIDREYAELCAKYGDLIINYRMQEAIINKKIEVLRAEKVELSKGS